MIKANNTKYIFYILIFIIFVITRTNYLLNENEIIDIEFKSLAIASCSFPFGIIKETVAKDFFSPIYYLLIHFFTYFLNDAIIIKFFNSIISLFNIFLIVKIGKKILNPALGYLLGFIFSINHFYLYYESLIAPYCLDFLLGTILLITIYDFVKKPNKKHTKYLIISNCAYIISTNLGFLFIIAELLLLYRFFEKCKNVRKNIVKISIYTFFSFLIPMAFLLIQYYNWTKLLIPNTYNGIGLNFNSLYLILNEYLSPYLSFDAPSIQTKSTLGMLYSYFSNTSLKNINTIKLLITLFYGSILPLFMLLHFTFKSLKENKRLRLILSISSLYFAPILILMFYEKIETHPSYTLPLFLATLILFGYGICLIKDNFIKSIVIFCIFAIQFINPEINSFNITINKNYPISTVFNSYIKEHSTNDALIIMPYMGKYANLYYQNLIFFNFDYSMLQKNNKKSILRNLCNKKTKTINTRNIKSLINNYLTETQINGYIAKYFIENTIEGEEDEDRIIFFIDKLNSRPISENSINKIAYSNNYSNKLKKINFYNLNSKNDSKILFDAIKSKTLYNLIDIATTSFYLENLIQYKKIDNEYFRVDADSKNVQKALTSYSSDYVFAIYKTYR